ncbi:PEP-CTERM sorting domain-containing protein [Singulisphaera sp. PoT]|uniref:PEP-CTERM sorting domain-containing protein n=1 Tax=Singulisphaera sp. PoT TaxID=3411797 RepID=UPI003BF5BE21
MTFVILLTFTALNSHATQASTLIQYTTSGTIESTGITGTPIISFVSLDQNQFSSASYFSLGNFDVAPLPAGQSTTYDDTPFHITLVVNQVEGEAPSPNQTPIVLNGHLNGKITGGTQSSVQATFDPIGSVQFQTGPYKNTLTLPGLKFTLVPSTTNNGLTTAEAHLTTTPTEKPVPEPTSIAMFLTTIAGLGLRQRLRSRRAA